MSVNRSILDNITGNHRATNVTALKVNVEAAQEALRQMSKLADEIEQAYMSESGTIRRCWSCCMQGPVGESKEALREAIEDCRGEYKQIYTGIRTTVEQTTQYLNALIEADAGLAEAIRNA